MQSYVFIVFFSDSESDRFATRLLKNGLDLDDKVERVFLTVIWSEFRMGQYRDDDHREDAPHFITNFETSLVCDSV